MNNSPSILLATLALNELEWLDKLWEQHKDWPGMVKHVFVEATDRMYAQANPEMVNDRGLSVDGTSEFLKSLAKKDKRVVYVPHGFCGSDDPAQGKCAARQRYLDVAEEVRPDFLIILDSDEMWCRKDQLQASTLMTESPEFYRSFIFRMRSIWHPPSVAGEPLFSYEAVGGVFSVPAARGWRWSPGLRYGGNHNTPTDAEGKSLGAPFMRFDRMPYTPQWIHMGFAASPKTRLAKNRYYVERGEGRTDHRQKYVDGRASFETWKPGDRMPGGASIRKYVGAVPECFQNQGA